MQYTDMCKIKGSLHSMFTFVKHYISRTQYTNVIHRVHKPVRPRCYLKTWPSLPIMHRRPKSHDSHLTPLELTFCN